MSVQFKDYYETLGVPRTASADDIRKAYRDLARKHHPDRAAPADKARAEERIKEINEAYEVLKDPDKRRKYDALGADWKNMDFAGAHGPHAPRGFRYYSTRGSPEFHFGGTGFSDFFEQFFGAGAGAGMRPFDGFSAFGGGAEAASRDRTGPDVEANIMVTLEEVLRGALRPISLRVVDPESGYEDTIEVKVRIPAGVSEGQRLRVRGKGGRGIGTAAPGDLYLKVLYAPHPDFRVKGNDLYHDLDLAPWEAVLGAKVDVPTLAGPVRLTIPPGTPSGRKLRLRGRGLPKAAGHGHGDLFVVVNIVVPEHPGPAERRLWQELAAHSTFHPRAR